jgi:predicted ABC-type ATPase
VTQEEVPPVNRGHFLLDGAFRSWRRKQYHLKLFFLSLKDPEIAIARIAERVAQGGHYIPDEIVRRRFHSGLRLFHTVYKHEVDSWRYYDNSGQVPILVDEGPH